MLLKKRIGRRCFPLLAAALIMADLAFANAQEIDAGGKANIRVRPEHAASQVLLQRMLLLMQPTATQRANLDALLSAQVTPGNPRFHQWVTPSQFADQFSNSAADAKLVAEWLDSQGFTVAALPVGRGWIEFSGTAALVEQAFGAQVVQVRGAIGSPTRFQVTGQITLPSSIAGKVYGLVSLDGTLSTASVTVPVSLNATTEALAGQTDANAAVVLTPQLVNQLLQLAGTAAGAQSTGSAGAGQTILIPARGTVHAEDIAAFRQSFGLPEGKVDLVADTPSPAGASGQAVSKADQIAVVMAASWAGVAAPGAEIQLVSAASTNATDGLDLALAKAIDSAAGNTVSVGYTSCESGMSAAHQEFYAALYRQAAAEGIAVIAASGDSGAAACHQPQNAVAVGSGYGVNALASTPWNTAVGAVASAPGTASLMAWQATGNAGYYATGGGASALYAIPGWQSAAGTSSASEEANLRQRLLPDISLPTAAAARGLAFCFSGETASSSCTLVSGGGSAASAALFAGMAAALAQTYGPQGNLAPNLYALSRLQQSQSVKGTSPTQAVFQDITAGSAELPCVSGTANCGVNGLIGFQTASGFDLATGIGSVNAKALLENWVTTESTGTALATVEMTSANGLTYNPSATITLSAKVISGSGGIVPTGTVQFYDESTLANVGLPVTLTTTGTASYTESGQFSTGGHNIAAIYSGDTIYAPNESQPVVITIELSPTSLSIVPSSTTPSGGSTVTVTGTVKSSDPGAASPTGTLTVNLDGIAQGTGTIGTVGAVTSGTVSVTIPTSGAHTLQGFYSGDTNYDPATSPAVTVTVAKIATATSLSALPTVITPGTPETFTAIVGPLTPVTGVSYTLTGNVSFYDGGTLLGVVAVSGNTAVLSGVTLSATSTHNVVANYSGDATYAASSSSVVVLVSTLQPVTVVLTASSGILAPGASVTLTATVTPVNTPPATAEQHPSGYVLFYAGTALIGTQAPVLVGPGYSGVASTFVSHLPAGNYVLTAVYSGDPTYGPATSNSLNLQVEDFTIACSAANYTIPQGTTSSGDLSCAVTSLGGLTGPIDVSCAEQNPPALGAITCYLTPNVVTTSGSPTLTIVTYAGLTNAAADGPRGKLDSFGQQKSGQSAGWHRAGSGIALAFAGLLLVPIGRRARLFQRSAGKLLMFALLLAGLTGVGTGCLNSTTITNNNGTPLGQHTLRITAAADVGTVTATHTTYITVNVTPAH